MPSRPCAPRQEGLAPPSGHADTMNARDMARAMHHDRYSFPSSTRAEKHSRAGMTSDEAEHLKRRLEHLVPPRRAEFLGQAEELRLGTT